MICNDQVLNEKAYEYIFFKHQDESMKLKATNSTSFFLSTKPTSYV
jgi:hypothetical protein